ncbi:PREDICTED: putative RNA exonuclease NEF-sp isoform X2 [Crocodylus porosus]|uniref:RNA exonuclease 5 n=1 Tax=Crocodylus porosus TaxID=8502 RepID=A0A7M4EF77_CROPO|nr:PREDICTED: putative RNA exonuclease NEF-sp isoform X2 [Crocodylus porosus]
MEEADRPRGPARPREGSDSAEDAPRRRGKRRRPEPERGGSRGAKEKKARLSAELFGEDCEISHDQVYEFLKYAALGKHHNAAQPSWCHIHHQRHLARVVVIVLHEVSQLHFYRFYLQFKHLRKSFPHRFSLPPDSANFIASMCREGVSAKHHNSAQASPHVFNGHIFKSTSLEQDPTVQKYGEKKHGLTTYTLTVQEMKENNYPLEGLPGCLHFVHTECNSPRTDSSPLFGLDCEMCLTTKGNEVTRVSLVDAQGQCLLDELIKPETQILNYFTRYSGITRKILLPVKTKLADVQDKLKKLLPHDAILVGHSLNADLRALQMIHPSVIDTSLLFARSGGRRFKLKFLAKAVLGKEIQCENKLGHDPTEDAQAALELAQYFIKQGPCKVEELNLETLLIAQKASEISQQKSTLYLQLNRVQQQSSEGSSIPQLCFLDSLRLAGQQTLLLGRQDLASPGSCQNGPRPSNKQILQRAIEEVPLSSFSVVQFSLRSKHVVPALVAGICEKMRIKLGDLLTLYAGPFGKDFCLKSVKKEFKKYGPVRSLTVITETQQPHICIQYEVLEAAQLALESLNGAEIAGSCIKVQRPVSAVTLDCNTLIKELEMDVENERVIYMAGVKKSLTETDLQEKLSQLKDLKALFLPRDHKNGKRQSYCFLKFRTAESASSALEVIKKWATMGSKLKSRRALTPSHLNQWINHMAHQGTQSLQEGESVLCMKKKQVSICEQDLREKLKKLDCRIKKLYRSLQNNTLCVVLLPGTNSVHRSLSGLGLMGIKDDAGKSMC